MPSTTSNRWDCSRVGLQLLNAMLVAFHEELDAWAVERGRLCMSNLNFLCHGANHNLPPLQQRGDKGADANETSTIRNSNECLGVNTQHQGKQNQLINLPIATSNECMPNMGFPVRSAHGRVTDHGQTPRPTQCPVRCPRAWLSHSASHPP